jgi:DNA/RNA-binding domain of Phe-tRNA-synthetase-like protein
MLGISRKNHETNAKTIAEHANDEQWLTTWRDTYRYIGSRAHLRRCAWFDADLARADVEALLATKPSGRLCFFVDGF